MKRTQTPLLATLFILLAGQLFAQAKIEPRFPEEVPGLVRIEAEDAVSTNFAREPTMDYASSGFRTLLLNREPQATGTPFFSEYSFILEEGGSFSLWIGGTPPGPQTELYPSFASPIRVIIDGGEPRAVYRENVDVVEPYALANYWYVLKEPWSLGKGVHTLRIEISERRRYDSRWYLTLDALFLLEAGSPLYKGTVDPALLPARFPHNLIDRSLNNPYMSIAAYEANIQAKPLVKEGYLQLAQVYGLLGDYANALKIISRGRLVAGEDPRFSLVGAKNRIWSGDVDEGLRLYREYLATPGSDPAVWAEAAKVSAWLGKYQDSLSLYREAMARFPDDLNLAVNYGLTLLWAGKVAEGQAALDAALAKARAAAQKIEELGSVLEVNGYRDKAREAYAEGLRLFPDELMLYLISAKAALADNDSAGEAAIQAAIRARFVPSERLDAILAKVEQDAGLKKAALLRYEERLAASPDDLELRRELVRAYYWNGRLDDAVKANGDILDNKLYRIFLDMEKELAETWRYLDLLEVYRLRLPLFAAQSRATADALTKALEAWKGAQAEVARSASSKEQAKKDRADAALAATGTNLVAVLARAQSLALTTEAVAGSAASVAEASGTEAAKVAADKETLGKLGAWRWLREADLAELSEKAAKGSALAVAILDRIDLIESRASLVRTRASLQSSPLAAAVSSAAQPLAASARSTTEAEVWLVGSLRDASRSGNFLTEAALSSGAYFPHGSDLVALLVALDGAAAPSDSAAPAPGQELAPVEDAASVPADIVDIAKASIASLQKAQAAIPGITADIKTRIAALHERASARLRLRWYQHDSESADERRELADIYLKLNRPRDAQAQLERVLAVAPGDVNATFTLGRTLDLSGDWSGAMRLYRQVYATDPRFENTASSYNRLARGHADRFIAAATSTIDTSRVSSQGRLEYAAGGTSLMSFAAAYALDDIRIHGSEPSSTGLQSLDLSLNLNLARLGATVFATVGGTVKNRLWSEATSSSGSFQPGDLWAEFAAAPKLAAGLNWSGGPFSLSGSWTFDQIKDSFLPGHLSWYEQMGEGTASAWFGLAAPSVLRSVSARLYGKAASLSAPFAPGGNFLSTGVGELSLGFLLRDSPWTTLTLGGNCTVEDAQDSTATDYYAPNFVRSAKGGLQISSWFGAGGGWVAGLSARAWGGWWWNRDVDYPSWEGQLRGELTKGDLSLWAEGAGSLTGDSAEAAYWSVTARIGGTIAVPSYIIP